MKMILIAAMLAVFAIPAAAGSLTNPYQRPPLIQPKEKPPIICRKALFGIFQSGDCGEDKPRRKPEKPKCTGDCEPEKPKCTGDCEPEKPKCTGDCEPEKPKCKTKKNASEHNKKGGNSKKGGKIRDGSKNKGKGKGGRSR